MTPEELKKLCDKAEGDHLAGRPCPECDARDELYEDFGFSSPARARSYAALWAAGQMRVDAEDMSIEDFSRKYGHAADDYFNDAGASIYREALATTEEKE